MPKNIVDVSTKTSPIVVPVGTDPRTAASVELAIQGLANRTELMANRTRDADGEFAYVDDAGNPVLKTQRLRIQGTKLTPRNNAATSTTTNTGRLQLETNSAFYDAYFELAAGMQIVAVRALLTPGAARAGANRMQLGLVSRPIVPFSVAGYGSTTTIGTPAADAGNTNFQLVEITGLTHTVTEGDVQYVYVQAGNTAASAADSVTFLEVEYTKTGPR